MGVKEIGVERALSALPTKLKEDDEYLHLTDMQSKTSKQPSMIGQYQTLQPGQAGNMAQTNTTNSSRKSSVSEYVYGTPPFSSYISNRTIIHEREGSINLADEQTIGDMIRTNHNILKSSNSVNHDILKRNPKCFGAKFTGQPGEFVY